MTDDEETLEPDLEEDELVPPPADAARIGKLIARKAAARVCHAKRKQDLIVGIFGGRGRGKSTLCMAAARTITREIGELLGTPTDWDVETRCTFGLLGFMDTYDRVRDPGVIQCEQWNVMMDARESMHALHQMVNHTVEMSRPYRQILLINMPIARMVDRNVSSLFNNVVEVTPYLGWARWYEYETDPLEGLRIAGRRRRVRLRYPKVTFDGEVYTIAGWGDSPGNVYFEPPPQDVVDAYEAKRSAFTESIRFETHQAAQWGKRIRVAEMLELVQAQGDGMSPEVHRFREAAEDGDEDRMIVAMDRLFPHRELKDWDVRRVVRILHPPAE